MGRGRHMGWTFDRLRFKKPMLRGIGDLPAARSYVGWRVFHVEQWNFLVLVWRGSCVCGIKSELIMCGNGLHWTLWIGISGYG